MHDIVLTSAEQVTAGWLSTVLVRSGTLLTGGVSDVVISPSESVNAHLIKIHVRYDDGATGQTGQLPSRLLLKMCAGTFGRSEVDYYARDYLALADGPLLTCYDAHYSERLRKYHILMDDVSESHRNNWKITPTLTYGRAVAQAAAILHAHWWGEQRLQVRDRPIPGEAEIERYHAHIQPGLLPMLASTYEDIDGSWAAMLHTIFERYPALLLERTKQSQGFTLVHGDLNPGNILSPRTGHGTTYLIDRQPFDWSLMTWLGVSDLSYMMVHWWDIALRRKWEYRILRQYHASLLQHGITDYVWEQLVYDYKLCAIQSIYVATEWCVLESDRVNMRWVWLPQLKLAMAAFFDLDCEALWAR